MTGRGLSTSGGFPRRWWSDADARGLGLTGSRAPWFTATRIRDIRITADGDVVLLDWDEARLDASCLDLARPPMPQPLSGLDEETFELGLHAFRAWEAAMFWLSAPDHARKQLARVP